MKDQLTILSEKLQILKNKVSSEEATKQSMVLPLLHILGYDIFDPEEVIPEVPCNLAYKGDKVDYVLANNGKHEILIECKECHQNLNNHISQLRKYFVASESRFAILTNGLQYMFFSDHKKSNIMDEEPFYYLDMLNITDEDIHFLTGIKKENFNAMQLLYHSQDLRYRNVILENLKSEFANPSKAFVSVMTSNFYKGKLHESIYNKFSLMIKDCLRSLITEDLCKDLVDIEKNSENTVDASEYTVKEKEIVDIVNGWLSKYVTENNHIYVRKLSDGYIRFCYGNDWWNICRIKYRPYWEYKYCVKICKESQAAKSISREVKTLEDFMNLQSEIEDQCQDSKTRLFKYRAEHNI